ncbi:MAG: right-handed parallel beta-helix repeat-containing protein [Planctomycetes bacterium]|nr:right-handed parallel beta-helix repeat-containing protein [Planctomycetota bacterium]
MMSKIIKLLIVCALLGACAAAGRTAMPDASKTDILYVESNGNDAWSGSLRTQININTDGPLRTLEGARDRIRKLKKEGTFTKPIDVYILDEGITTRFDPFVLDPCDSGSAGCPIRYIGPVGKHKRKAPHMDGAKYYGGRSVQLYPYEPPRYRNDLGWSVITDVPQLFVDEIRRYRARLPATGYFTIAGDMAPTGRFGARPDRFVYSDSDIRKEWSSVAGKPGSVEVVAYHLWGTSRLRIADVDENSRTVMFCGATCSDQFWSSLAKGNRYVVENAPNALAGKGDWYFDRETKRLEFAPDPLEEAKEEESDRIILIKKSWNWKVGIIPLAESFLELRGNPEKKEWVSNITFENLSFRFSAWNLPAEGYSFPQAEVGLPAAVRAVGARNCKFKNCLVGSTGAWAVELGQGCKDNLIEDSIFEDLGAGGIKIGETAIRENDDLVASHNIIRNCTIKQGGRIHPAAVGVWIGQSHDNIIEGNEISDFYYTGISVGWTWGYGPSNAHHNQIINNNISKIGQGVLSDMGGIYTLGVQPGTVLRGNRIHDVDSFSYGGWGIYTDEGSTGILIEDNIVYNTKSAGFHQHYGRENIINHNIFAFGGEAQVMRTRAEKHLSFTFTNNIVYSDGRPILGGDFSGSGFHFDNNTYFDASGAPVQFRIKSLDEWRADGQDIHSTIADPKFTNPKAGDFSTLPGSPMEKWFMKK